MDREVTMNPYMQYSEKLDQNKEVFTWEFEEMTDFDSPNLASKTDREIQYFTIKTAYGVTLQMSDRKTIVIPQPYTIPPEVKKAYADKGIDLV